MNRVCLLQGRPGSGKTVLGATTAPKKPIHLVDVDAKAVSTYMLQSHITKGDLIIHTLGEPLVSARLDDRARQLSKNEKPSRPPQGWVKFATIIEALFVNAEKTKVAPGGTLMIDSWTFANEHLKRFVIYHDDRGHATLNDRNWGTFLNMNVEAITGLRDSCARWDMDLIITVHERTSDVPTERTTFRRTTDDKGVSRRTMEGDTKAMVSPSVEGQFSNIMPSHFSEVYQCYVDVDVVTREPRWRVRLKPDGLRDLRTSLDMKELDVEPDLSKLWI